MEELVLMCVEMWRGVENMPGVDILRLEKDREMMDGYGKGLSRLQNMPWLAWVALRWGEGGVRLRSMGKNK